METELKEEVKMKHDLSHVAKGMISLATCSMQSPFSINSGMHFILLMHKVATEEEEGQDDDDQQKYLYLYENNPCSVDGRLVLYHSDWDDRYTKPEQIEKQTRARKLFKLIETIDECDLHYYLSQVLDGHIETGPVNSREGFKIYWDFSTAENNKFPLGFCDTHWQRLIDMKPRYFENQREIVVQLAVFIVELIVEYDLHYSMKPVYLIFKKIERKFSSKSDLKYTIVDSDGLEVEASLSEKSVDCDRIKLFSYRDWKINDSRTNDFDKKISWKFNQNLLEMLQNALISPRTVNQLIQWLDLVFQRDFSEIGQFELTQKSERDQLYELIIKFIPSEKLTSPVSLA